MLFRPYRPQLYTLILLVLYQLIGMNNPCLAKQEESWKLNVDNTDIRTLIELVSNITGYSFVVSPRIKGSVTVISPRSLSSDAIYEIFLSVLNVHGYATVRSGEFIKIIPNNTIKQTGLPFPTTTDREKIITQVIQLEHTQAITLVPILRPMIPRYGHLAAVASANALVIIDHASNLRRIVEVINQIDYTEGGKIEVIQLYNSSANHMVELLEQLSPTSKKTRRKRYRKRTTSNITMAADKRNNRIIIKGQTTARSRLKKLINKLDAPAPKTSNMYVIQLHYGDAKKIAELITNVMEVKHQARFSRKRNNIIKKTLSIQADEDLNALVVSAEPSKIQEIKTFVRKLDIPQKQVLIQTIIIEVSGDESDALSIQWGAGNKLDNTIGTINFTNFGTSLNTAISSLNTNQGSAALANGITLAAGKEAKPGEYSYGTLIQALNNATNTNLLSTPSIMTVDNEEAEIIVGQNVPFITGSSTDQSGSNPFNTISREDVGLKLKVTPHISQGNTIKLQLELEISSVVPTAEGIKSADIITNKRSISTYIAVENEQIIVLGGLMRDDYVVSESRVPILSHIPLLGKLFRSTTTAAVKQNLLVMLSPHILESSQDYRQLVNEFYKAIPQSDISSNRKDSLPIDAESLIIRPQ